MKSVYDFLIKTADELSLLEDQTFEFDTVEELNRLSEELKDKAEQLY